MPERRHIRVSIGLVILIIVAIDDSPEDRPSYGVRSFPGWNMVVNRECVSEKQGKKGNAKE